MVVKNLRMEDCTMKHISKKTAPELFIKDLEKTQLPASACKCEEKWGVTTLAIGEECSLG